MPIYNSGLVSLQRPDFSARACQVLFSMKGKLAPRLNRNYGEKLCWACHSGKVGIFLYLWTQSFAPWMMHEDQLSCVHFTFGTFFTMLREKRGFDCSKSMSICMKQPPSALKYMTLMANKHKNSIRFRVVQYVWWKKQKQIWNTPSKLQTDVDHHYTNISPTSVYHCLWYKNRLLANKNLTRGRWFKSNHWIYSI